MTIWVWHHQSPCPLRSWRLVRRAMVSGREKADSGSTPGVTHDRPIPVPPLSAACRLPAACGGARAHNLAGDPSPSAVDAQSHAQPARRAVADGAAGAALSGADAAHAAVRTDVENDLDACRSAAAVARGTIDGRGARDRAELFRRGRVLLHRAVGVC